MGLRSSKPPQLRTGAQNEPSQLAASVEKKWQLGPKFFDFFFTFLIFFWPDYLSANADCLPPAPKLRTYCVKRASSSSYWTKASSNCCNISKTKASSSWMQQAPKHASTHARTHNHDYLELGHHLLYNNGINISGPNKTSLPVKWNSPAPVCLCTWTMKYSQKLQPGWVRFSRSVRMSSSKRPRFLVKDMRRRVRSLSSIEFQESWDRDDSFRGSNRTTHLPLKRAYIFVLKHFGIHHTIEINEKRNIYQ